MAIPLLLEEGSGANWFRNGDEFMNSAILRSTFRALVLLAPLVLVVSGTAQTVRITFDEIPRFTVLSDQFAAEGIHFLQEGRYQRPTVRPIIGAPGSGHSLALVPNEGSVGIRFDRPLQSFSMTFAVAPGGGAPQGSLFFTALCFQYPPNLNHGGPVLFVPANTWQTIPTYTTPVATQGSIQVLDLASGNIFGGFNYPSYYYLTELTATMVPEPSSAALLVVGGAALLLRRKRGSG